MYVAGAVRHGALNQRVDEVDDRTAGGHLVDLGVVVRYGGFDDFEVFVNDADEVGGVLGAGRRLVDRLDQVIDACKHGANAAAKALGDFVEARNGLRIRGSEIDDAAHLKQRHYAQSSSNLLVQFREISGSISCDRSRT